MSNSEFTDKNIEPNIRLPFNNLFLNQGFISGNNSPARYIATIIISIFAYFSYQVFMIGGLLYYAQKNGIIINASNLNKLLDPDYMGISKNIILSLELGMFAFTLLIFYFAIKNIHKKDFLSVITAYPNIRWNRVFFAFGLWTLVLILMFIIDYFFISGKDDYIWNFNPSKFFYLFIISILLFPLQTSFEEIFFRGYLMQATSFVSFNGLFPLLFTSLLFGMAHMSNPETAEYGVWIMLPFYSLFGLFLGILTLWNNGLELSLGIHAANNIVSSLLVTSKNTVLNTDSLFIVKNENPLSQFISWIIAATIVLLIFQKKYQFKNHLQQLK